jgi:hypothetical protein
VGVELETLLALKRPKAGRHQYHRGAPPSTSAMTSVPVLVRTLAFLSGTYPVEENRNVFIISKKMKNAALKIEHIRDMADIAFVVSPTM